MLRNPNFNPKNGVAYKKGINIKFTYEAESNNTLPFLDVLAIRKNKSIETTVYRKPTNNDIYLNWNSFSPKSWINEVR